MALAFERLRADGAGALFSCGVRVDLIKKSMRTLNKQLKYA
jgi:hypothetical protein